MEPCGPPTIAATPVAKQPVSITARVTVCPEVTCQPPTVVCVGPPRIVKWGEPPSTDGVLSPDGKCRLTIAQDLLISVPVSFGAGVALEPAEVYVGPASAATESTGGEGMTPAEAVAGSSPAAAEDGPPPAEAETSQPQAPAEAEAPPAEAEVPPDAAEAAAPQAPAEAEIPPAEAEAQTQPAEAEAGTPPAPQEAASHRGETPATSSTPEDEGTRSV